jgi:hypothetical protein
MNECSVCNRLERDIHWSKDTMGHIRSVIGDFVTHGELRELGEVTPAGPFLTVRYQCTKCNTVWRLTYPDQGMKGGFERERIC